MRIGEETVHGPGVCVHCCADELSMGHGGVHSYAWDVSITGVIRHLHIIPSRLGTDWEQRGVGKMRLDLDCVWVDSYSTDRRRPFYSDSMGDRVHHLDTLEQRNE